MIWSRFFGSASYDSPMMTLCESGNRTSNRFAFSNQSPWFTRPGKNGTTTFAFEGSINRYYDPSTDQFLSVDLDVQTTDQPYAFTNDDPLNSTDPLGTVMNDLQSGGYQTPTQEAVTVNAISGI